MLRRALTVGVPAVILFSLFIVSLSMAASDQLGVFNRLTGLEKGKTLPVYQGVKEILTQAPPPRSKPAESCEDNRARSGPFYFLPATLFPGAIYWAHQDPGLACTGSPYTFEVTDAHFYAVSSANAGIACFRAEVWSVAGSVSCPEPGTVLGVGPSLCFGIPGGVTGLSITLPLAQGPYDHACVDGPYFIAIVCESVDPGVEIGVWMSDDIYDPPDPLQFCTWYTNIFGGVLDFVAELQDPGDGHSYDQWIWSSGRTADENQCSVPGICGWEWQHCVYATGWVSPWILPSASGLRDQVWQKWTSATPCTVLSIEGFGAGAAAYYDVLVGDPGFRISIHQDGGTGPGTEIVGQDFTTAEVAALGTFDPLVMTAGLPLVLQGDYYIMLGRASWAGDGDTVAVATDDADCQATCNSGMRDNVGSDLTFCDAYGTPYEVWVDVYQCCAVSPYSLSFYQLDFNLDGNFTGNTDWGSADLTYPGSEEIMYFNLTVNGSWQVQNIPVLSIEGANVEQTQSFPFDLGNNVGDDVAFLNYAFSFTPDTLPTAPVGGTPVTVGKDTVSFYNSGDEHPFPIVPAPAEPLVGGKADEPVKHSHANFPNQQAGPYECAPTAVSNSLKFLNDKHNMKLKAADMTIAKWKTVLGFIANWGVPRDTWPDLKDAYMKANKIPITTRKVPAGDIDKIAAEIDAGQDVEMEVFGHTVCVVGITKLKNGKYKFDIAHDRNQDDNKPPPKKPETGVWDPVTKTWSGTFKGRGLNYFVVECPKKPDATPGKSKHSTDDYKPSDGDPRGTQWHELYPNYCEMWTLTSWIDNGDGVLSYCDTVDFTHNVTGDKIWEHVKLVTPTITVTKVFQPEISTYLDMLNENPLIDPVDDPVGTYWHEVHPDYCRTYRIESWEDNGNGYLDFCDYIELHALDGPDSCTTDIYHVEGLATDIVTTPVPPPGKNRHGDGNYEPGDGDPRGSKWHELYPNYCEMWTLTSWHDNGDGYLSYCDTVDFTHDGTGKVVWEHIEYVTPTITVNRVSEPTVDTYLDMLEHNSMVEPVDDPVGTYWHEVYPNYCRMYQVVSWEDNGNGYLDSCDYIELHALDGPDSCTTDMYHVVGLATDIVTTPLPGSKHNEDGYRPPDGDPRGSLWHELYPEYCQMWELTSWIDNGDGILSVCDVVDFTNLDTQELIYEHIDAIMPTITVTEIQNPSLTSYLDMMDPNPLIDPVYDPVGTSWHEVHPNYCREYVVVWWEDNGNGYLDFCDYIGLQALNGPNPGSTVEYHVEGFATDITTTRVEPPSSCNCGDAFGDITCDGQVNPIDVVYIVNYVYKNLDDRCTSPDWNCLYDPGDVNCDLAVNPVDVVRYVNYVYKNITPFPCAGCE